MPEFTEQEIQVLVDEFREANVLPQYWSYAFELLAADKTHPVDARVHNVLTEIRARPDSNSPGSWKKPPAPRKSGLSHSATAS